MIILIIYHETPVTATLISDFKVQVPVKDIGPDIRIYETAIELDQCRECGVWCSEDEELYGDGYCTKCACMCCECETYHNSSDMTILHAEKVCTNCLASYEKKYPNNFKYHIAIDDLVEPDVNRGDVRVTFEYIGEGTIGDYTGDEDDIPLMRFTIFQKIDVPNGNGRDHPDWNWGEVVDGSYCTQIPVDTPNETLEKIALKILDEVKDDIMQGNSIKRLAEDLTYIDENFLTEKI